MGPRLLVQGMYGGRVEQTGPYRVEASYPHRFITFMLTFLVVFFGLAAVLMLVGAIAAGKYAMLAGVVMCLLMTSIMGFFVHTRRTTMGNFVIDAQAQSLTRWRGKKEVERLGFHELDGVGKTWDVLHRGFGRAFWLIVRTKDGRKLRVGKGQAAEVDAALQVLNYLGLPIR